MSGVLRRIVGALRAGARDGRPPAAGGPFRDDPAELARVDWAILQHGAVALYHRHAVLTEDRAWLAAHGYRIYDLDAAGWASPADFHADVRRVLELTGPYGANLAALVDALGEPPLAAEPLAAIVVRHFDAFAGRDAALAQRILGALEDASRHALLFGRRLVALIQSDDPRVRFDRVGERPVCWNWREWLDSSRGVGIEGRERR
ncbi:MAG TPA: barstar family protein [Gemmatimonadaceae bacterium]|nr:barstar family protein [Gemmatimonadaceae bacterium]